MMWLAVHEVIRPKWTEQIHEEWIRNVLKDRSDLSREKLERTRRLMDEHAGDCLVTGYEQHVDSLSLPDPDDRHVLAAAIEAAAEAIITWNLRDFPSATIAEHGIAVQTPDQLIKTLLETDRNAVLEAMKDHRATLHNPPATPAEYLEKLIQQGLQESAKLVRAERPKI